MLHPSNTLADLPAGSFALLALCEACGRRGRPDRTQDPANVGVRLLRGRLRCSKSGSRDSSIRIVDTAAGGFRSGGASRVSP